MNLKERCRAVELLVVDVDGVLTAGGISYSADDNYLLGEMKTFHVRDGSALKAWHAAGKRSLILTGRSSKVVDHRAAELGVTHVIQGASDKKTPLLALLAKWKMTPQAACYVGDDVPDVPAMSLAGLAAAPADACCEARAAANYVCRAEGGCGAVREVIELVLRCQGKWVGTQGG
jgi:3-deoxy-D-manno-octulosonate 8-phosphate phosphatase (KDO 8-P phosphatase)